MLGAKWCGYNSVLVAEVLALKEEIRAAKFLGINKLEIEGVNLWSINAIKNTWKIPWEIALIIEDINRDLATFEEVTVKHI